ncbi:MAG: hypothetical protein ACK5TU_04590 [Cyclobacteriaceae bacterium]|jgi:hypothetical protein
MTRNLKIYVNGLFYDHLSNSSIYGDRVEFYRTHEKSLWTINQLAKLKHEITITDEANQIEVIIKDIDDLKNWVRKDYPDFVHQLDDLHYTKYPHPNDFLTFGN